MSTSEPTKLSMKRLGTIQRKAINVPQKELLDSSYKIAFVYLPFANLHMPSIGMTQLSAVTKMHFQGRVSVDLHYLTIDFAHYLGLDLYNSIVTSPQHNNSGLGGWLFRQSAFPEAPDNSEEFYRRFYPWQDEQTYAFRELIEEKRRGLDAFLIHLITKYALDEAQIVGLSSMFHQNMACFALARKIKDLNPDAITVMGGANCEAPMGPAIVRNIDQIDFAFSGPGLKSFPAFVQKCLDRQLEDASSISGVYAAPRYELAYAQIEVDPPLALRGRASSQQDIDRQTASGAVLVLEPTLATQRHGTHGEELDINVKIPLDYEPFLNALEQSFPNQAVEPVLTFETSRGCWWGEKAHCTFCGLNDLTIKSRTMQPEYAIEFFNALFQYAPRCSRFLCVDNILPKRFLKEVLPHLNTPPNVTMLYEAKSDLDEEGLQIIARAGLRIIQPGIEALSNRALKLMQKGATVFVNLRLLKSCLLYEVYPAWNILIGTPGEDEQIYAKYVRDIPLLVHLPPPTGVWPVEFHRFSPNFENAAALGLDLHPREFCELTYPFEEEVLKDLVWNFEDRNTNALHFIYVAKWLGKIREQLTRWLARWDGSRDDLPHPYLYVEQRDAGHIVYDTRSGEVIEHALSPIGKHVLDQLAKPSTVERLVASSGAFDGAELEREVTSLQERGLLFQEDDTFMSLVLPRKPLPRHRWDQWPTGWRVF
jgi:ribosomal peptide maturation radical SAM protein 1